MTHLQRAPGEKRIEKWTHRRFAKRCRLEIRAAERSTRVCERKHDECGGTIRYEVRAHCWCLGPVNPTHTHLVCENCGDIGQFEAERRARRMRVGRCWNCGAPLEDFEKKGLCLCRYCT